MHGDTLPQVLGWLLSYALHSTILLGGAWAFTRVLRVHPATADIIWKSALLGGLVTATAQTALDIRPTGSVALAAARTADDGNPIDRRVPDTRREGASDAPAGESGEGVVPIAPAAGTPIRPATIILLGWAACAVMLAGAYAARRLILVGRLGDRRTVQESHVLGELNALQQAAGMRRALVLTTSATISSPVALGLSEICLPGAALSDLDAEQRRSMLAHELAHLVRRDPVWLDAASMMERVFFFQPLNRLARREMQVAAEYLCDDWAARHAGTGVPLARCLAKVAEWIQASPLGVPVAGMAEQRSLLVTRITRLIEGTPLAVPRSSRGLAVLAAGVMVAMVVVAPRVAGRGVGPQADVHREAGEQEPGRVVPSFGAEGDEPVDPPSTPHRTARGDQPAPTPQDTAVVSALIARLRDDDASVRSAAARALGRIEDPRAVTPLIAALKDTDAAVREAAADALGSFEDTRAIGPLADLLSDSSGDVRRSALGSLSNFERGVPSAPVIRLLDDGDADVRHQAAHMLASMKVREAVAPLSRLLGDGSSEVREAALEALGELGDPAAAGAITQRLTDPVADVRRSALQALCDLKVAIPEAALLTLLRDGHADVRSTAANVAGERSIVAAIPELRRMLDDTNADVREAAVDALSEIVAPAARDALRQALESKDPAVRRQAAQALGERNDQ